MERGEIVKEIDQLIQSRALLLKEKKEEERRKERRLEEVSERNREGREGEDEKIQEKGKRALTKYHFFLRKQIINIIMFI